MESRELRGDRRPPPKHEDGVRQDPHDFTVSANLSGIGIWYGEGAGRGTLSHRPEPREVCVALLPGKGDGDGRASPATAPTPIRGFPELRPPTRQPGWAAEGRRVSVAGTARGCSRWGTLRGSPGGATV